MLVDSLSSDILSRRMSSGEGRYLEGTPISKWKNILAILIIITVALILLWQIVVGLTSGLWDVPLLTILAFALWIAIYVFLSAKEESA